MYAISQADMAKFKKLYSAPISGTKAEVSAVGMSLGSYHIVNLTSSLNYVQVFDALAANVTVGTTVPLLSLPLPASGGATLYLGGLDLCSGLTLACTTTATGASTSDAFIVLTYKL
jgi:hypothetical protein